MLEGRVLNLQQVTSNMGMEPGIAYLDKARQSFLIWQREVEAGL